MDRITPPPFKKSLEFKLPKPEKISSFGPNEIWYLPSTISETVKIEIIYKAGNYFESAPGEAQLALHLVDKGVGGKSANDIANELDYYGSHLDLKIGYDFSSISLYALKRNIGRLLPLFFEITQKPTFPNKELDIIKKIFIENLRVNLEKNEFVASNRIREQVYGSHPYGRRIQISDFERVTIDEVKSFFEIYFKPFKVFIIGNVDPGAIIWLKENLNLSNHLPPEIYQPFEDIKANNTQADAPNKSQASIRLGRRTIMRNHPDWPALQLLNHILGGYFGSRLMKNIREEKGLTYGVHSSIQSMLHSSSLNIAAEVNSKDVDLALNEIYTELRRLSIIETKELEMSQNHFIASLQNDVTTIFSAAERIKTAVLNNLPVNHYQDLILEISKIDKNEVGETCDTYFNPGQFASFVIK